MPANVAELFVETLERAGVGRIYEVVGDSLNALTEALRQRGSSEWVHVRHEEAAAFAAAGESQVSGQLAVCAGSCGPGTPRLINGLPTTPSGPGRRCWRSPPRDPLGRDRRRLAGDPPAGSVPRVQRLLRDDLRPQSDALRAGERHRGRGRPARGRGGGDPGRRGATARPGGASRPPCCRPRR